MFRDKRTGRWRAMVTVRGRRISKLCASRSEAERFEYEAKHGLVKGETRRERITFRDFAERWHRDYCKVEKAASQWRRNRYDLDLHLLPAFGDVRLSELRKAHLVELRAALRQKPGRGGEPLSPKSVNNLLVLAKQILGQAVEWDLLGENPWTAVKPLKCPERPYAYWTLSEFEAFREKAEEVDLLLTRIATVAFHTGLRAGELAALRFDDLDFESGLVRVRATVDLTTGCRQETTKGKRVGFVQMNRAVRQALEPARFLKGSEGVFPMDPFWNLCRNFRRLCRAVGAREIRFHDLRHSFASGLAAAGVDLLKIQKEMRHQSYQMTLRYAHLHPDSRRGVTDVLCVPAHRAHNEEGEGGKRSGPTRT